MTQLVKCPACGVKTSAGRDACPRCETSLSGAPVCETTARAVAAHLPRRPGPETEPLRPTDPESPGPGDTAAPDRATFDTDISELFPKRRRFGVIDLLLVAGLVGWLVVLSDMRVWVEDGVVSFSTSSARAGIAQAATPVALEPVEASAQDTSDATLAEAEGEAVPETEPLPPAAVSMNAGNQLFERGEFAAAVEQYEAAVAVAPDDPQARNNLGQTLVRLDRKTEALPHFEEAIRLDPESWAYHFNLAHTFGDLGSWNRAAAQYREAFELFPTDVATNYNLGRALHQWGDYREAVAAYLRAIALAPDEPSFFLSLAKSYDALVRPADVAAAYTRYLKMEPGSAQADVVRERLDALQHPADTGPDAAQSP